MAHTGVDTAQTHSSTGAVVITIGMRSQHHKSPDREYRTRQASHPDGADVVRSHWVSDQEDFPNGDNQGMRYHRSSNAARLYVSAPIKKPSACCKQHKFPVRELTVP